MTTCRFAELPASMRSLPIDDRGFPIPWFVAWVDGEPKFPIMDGSLIAKAWGNQLCWVCGKPLGRKKVSVIGPMCAINRTSSEPPSHLECARFSAINCPFLAQPNMKRQTDALRKKGIETVDPAGIMLPRNPGVTMLWIAHRMPSPFSDGDGGVLFRLPDPASVEFYAHGRRANRDEVMASIKSGLPALLKLVEQDPDRDGAERELTRRLAETIDLLPERDLEPGE